MSSTRGNQAWVQDMLASIEHIEAYTAGIDFEQFEAAQQTQHAVLFNLQVIGEAAGKLAPALRETYPSLPWTQMIGMRNVIVHGYFSINLTIIWKTITEELPVLKTQLAALLADLEGTPL
jgi:uncharacterized protein with HEPN domain